MSITATEFNGAISASRTAIVTAIGLRYGSTAQGFAGILLGQPARRAVYAVGQFEAARELVPGNLGELRKGDFGAIILAKHI